MLSNLNSTQIKPVLHPATHMGPVTLAVSNLSQSIDFYTNVLGMALLSQQPGQATLGAGAIPLLRLTELPNAKRQPTYSTGLYHMAILLPSRADMGRVILNLIQKQYPVQGFGDHLVSEAMYLADPDGNGLEVYRDRPRSEWQWDGNQIVMATDPVDVEGVIASVPNPEAPFAGMPEGTTIGHMHLRVGDIPKAQAFYNGVIGFDVVAKMPSALFVSAGGYHHHLGMNIWQSRGAPRPPAESVGLREFTVLMPDQETLDQLVHRLDDAGISHDQIDKDVLADDPWGNPIRFVMEGE